MGSSVQRGPELLRPKSSQGGQRGGNQEPAKILGRLKGEESLNVKQGGVNKTGCVSDAAKGVDAVLCYLLISLW